MCTLPKELQAYRRACDNFVAIFKAASINEFGFIWEN